MTTTNQTLIAAARAAALSLLLAACAQMSEQAEPAAPPEPAAQPQPPAKPERAALAAAAAPAAKPGCEVMTTLPQQLRLLQQGKPFQNPPVNDFASNPGLTADLRVAFRNPVLAGCTTTLRQYAGNKYDGRPVGPTMLIRPGQTYRAHIDNQLPDSPDSDRDVRMFGQEMMHKAFGGHGGNSTMFGYVPPERTMVNHNDPGGFNVTNLHTHGWHVDPTENHDNIFAAIGPGDPTYLQEVALPADHPGGTFWYHAHLHGSTALQVSSGMAGALIVNDPTRGLDAVPQIARAKDLTFVLQQIAYNTDGVVDESYANLNNFGYRSINRPVFVNGLAYPVIEVQVGEVQRWRFIHAGVTDGIKPRLINAATNVLPMYEIALDGLPTGSLRSIQNGTLSPGYRVDVLAKFSGVNVGDTLYLIDSGQPQSFRMNDQTWQNMRYILAQIKVVAGTPAATQLPSQQQVAAAKADYVYGSYQPGARDPFATMGPLNDITEEQITGKTQIVHYFATNTYTCPDIGGTCTPCPGGEECNPNRVYMTCDGKDQNGDWMCMEFNSSADYARTLALDTASKWQVSGDFRGNNSNGQSNHTFHVHVNPFQVQRKYVDGSTGAPGEEWVWKDTLRTPVVRETGGDIATLKSRYTVFTGAFVQHCHVLHHEDRGMMQVVEITPADTDIIEMLRLHEAEGAERAILRQLREE